MRIIMITVIFFTIICIGCNDQKTSQTDTISTPEQEETIEILTDTELLDKIQKQTFNYFWEGAEPNSGLARERIHLDNIYPQNDEDIITTGGSGFGLMAILIGIERNYITRNEGVLHFKKVVQFLEKADRFHGAWPHWINGKTGKVKPFSQKDNGGDLVETAFLIQGLLTVSEYFKEGNENEKELVQKIDKLWKEVEWDWYTKNGERVLYWHWSPDYEWEMNFPVGGYNECLIMYVLAASSPTHSIDKEVYKEGWSRNGDIAKGTVFYGLDTELDHYEHDNDPIGPLFWAHYSYLGLNPKGLTDQYADYWKLNKNHAKIHYNYALDNPNNFEGYGKDCWGLTSSYSMKGYSSHRPGRDLGVISPTAALSSFPYTPKESMQFLRFMYEKQDSLIGKYGPYDAFSLQHDWYVPRYLAIDQGPIPVMIENHRTQLLWNLFMKNNDVKNGLQKLGFSYGN
ncbi:glucoamylase family protein [Aquimarina algiphila]|uniref:glucoamylase family protein n=1 Tax=Aquimarina algiphila TaxID=2047982 RepID=UPI00232DA669|nr:glucoamylase family protein [Aquimarina algiphila]